MNFAFAHNNLNVAELARSLAFYEEALGLRPERKHETKDFTLAFLTDGQTPHRLELTCLTAHPQPYALGENESHLAFTVDDYEAAHALHARMGCICYENEAMGLYFIADPDGYWIEILPRKK